MAVNEKSKRLLIIDNDAGTDDAQAILMALSAPDIEVLALTTTHGNITALQSARNVLRILQVVDRMDIPVHKGAEKALLGTELHSTEFHGIDGFGDAPDPNAPGDQFINPEHGVDALIRIITKFPGQVTLVATGPLTNIALALRLNPTFGKNLKDCIVMGGNYRGEGNITPAGEFNFAADPEAAQVVLNELGSIITLVTWELSWDYRLNWDFYEESRNQGTKKAEFLKKIDARMVRHNSKLKWDYIMCDEIAMSVFLDPAACAEAKEVYMSVECHGTLTRGQAMVDWRGMLGKPPNVKLVTKLNTDKYLKTVRLATY